MTIDIVYPYHEAKSGWSGNELRFSLRSLEKHFMDDFRVWVIGDFPAWATAEINHIPFDRFTLSSGPAFSNNANIAQKICMACRKFDKFIIIADDQYLLKDTNKSLFEKPFCLERLKERPAKCSKWQKRLWSTVDKLQDLGMTTFNAECHTPFLVDADRFLRVNEIFSLQDGAHLWKTAYLNYHHGETGAVQVPQRATAFSSRETETDFAKLCAEAWFLCQNDAGLTSGLKAFLMARFNRPSRFEKFFPVKNKIFGIGMPKTGTNSLTRALKDFGYNAVHYPHYPMEMGAKTAATDMPVANNFEQLDKKYKHSKFILTVRDDDSWIKSAVHHFAASNKSSLAFDNRKKMFGAKMPDAAQLMAGKLTHEKKVLAYFNDRPEDLLVLNIFTGEGYPEMAKFLNISQWPEKNFPHLNKRQDKYT